MKMKQPCARALRVRLWTLLDEPLVNNYFETIDKIEEILVERCHILSEMKAEIRDLTYYHWLG